MTNDSRRRKIPPESDAKYTNFFSFLNLFRQRKRLTVVGNWTEQNEEDFKEGKKPYFKGPNGAGKKMLVCQRIMVVPIGRGPVEGQQERKGPV